MLDGLLGLFVFGLFFRCCYGDFSGLDDPQYIYKNPQVLAGLSRNGLHWAFFTYHAANWHPLTWLSLQLNVALFGPDPWSFHFADILLHSLSAVILSGALRRLTCSAILSWLTALLFAAHPLRVESVAWASERKDVLSLFFGILALAGYAWYAQDRTICRWSLMLVAFLLSLLAKPMLVTFPFVLLLLDFWPLGRFRRERTLWMIVEKLPLLAASMACSAITMRAQAGGGIAPIESFPWNIRLANSLLSLQEYFLQTFWPVHLAAFYPHPRAGLGEPRVWLAGGPLLAITGGIVWYRKQAPYLFVGFFWWIGTLFPVLGSVVQVGLQGHADRYTYWPHIGLFLGIVWGVAALCDKLRLPLPARKLLPMTGVVPLALLSFIQMGTWKSVPAMWSHAIAVTENNAAAMSYLAGWHIKQGQNAKAFDLYQRALRVDPQYFPARYFLAYLYLESDQYEPAVKLLEQARKDRPQDSRVWFTLSSAYAHLGRSSEARECLETVIRLKPDDGTPYYQLGLLLMDPENLPPSIRLLQEAVRLKPESAQFHTALGKALCSQDRDAEGVKDLQAALDLGGHDADTAEQLGMALERLGRFPEAEAVLKKAISNETSPRVAMLQALCGLVTSSQGKADEANRLFKAATQKAPKWKDAVLQLGWKWTTAEQAGHRRPVLARQAARLLIAAFPNQPEGYDLLAAVLAAQGHFDDAVKEADRAMALAPEGVPLRKSIKARQDHYRKKQAWVGTP